MKMNSSYNNFIIEEIQNGRFLRKGPKITQISQVDTSGTV